MTSFGDGCGEVAAAAAAAVVAAAAAAAAAVVTLRAPQWSPTNDKGHRSPLPPAVYL